jgi:hypothetical protein
MLTLSFSFSEHARQHVPSVPPEPRSVAQLGDDALAEHPADEVEAGT